MTNKGKFNFITLNNVKLRNFSLYEKDGRVVDIDENINKGVYCLAGANGLGKTSFLNAINYCLTSIVLEPNKEVYSPNEIVTNNKRYTNRYFIGRIKEKDRNMAEVEVSFTVNNLTFRVVRGFEDREELRNLEIYKNSENNKISVIEKDNLSPVQLNELYQDKLTEAIGIKNFEYFVFYQLYILTFDENRRMIFWDDRASSHTLSIAFNTNLDDTERIISLKRKMEKLESDGRNIRWQATQLSNKIKALKSDRKDNSDDADLKKEYEKDNLDLDNLRKELDNVKVEYDTMLNKLSHLNSESMQLRMAHTRLFSNYSEPRSQLLENKNIKQSIESEKCCICGSQSHKIVENIKKNVYEDNCPLCDTKINEEKNLEQEKLLTEIQKNDRLINQKNLELENLIVEVNGKKNELDKVELAFNRQLKKIEGYIKKHPTIEFDKNLNSLNVLMNQYVEQYQNLDKESKECYLKRDKIRPEYEILLEKTNSAYKEAEIIFVPIFKKLASSFIGLDLNIKFEKSAKSIYLVLELENTARTASFQLSESQRFFLDIALRMALSIFLSKDNNEATMLIDTPEGSLDIAYESRVGKMFAEYVKNYNQNILMTANINASQLLITLAEECKKSNMKFRRMLDWTDLSPIQKQGEHLFEKVYNNIEAALISN